MVSFILFGHDRAKGWRNPFSTAAVSFASLLPERKNGFLTDHVSGEALSASIPCFRFDSSAKPDDLAQAEKVAGIPRSALLPRERRSHPAQRPTVVVLFRTGDSGVMK